MNPLPRWLRAWLPIAAIWLVWLEGAESLVCAAVPRVDFLVPGFTARLLPVRVSNIDNVEYGPDGRLYAAGYDGRVHVLTDTDGDGLEDTVKPFWDQPGDLLTPVGMVVAKEGVYIAARGKIALLRDTNGDGRADVSETAVSGWTKERHNSANRNDASGVALDRAGNLYFGLGCSDYRNAFLVDSNGLPHYSLQSERGTILKVAPGRKSREIFSTGIRFGISLQFNRHGDLFATDQEGDTFFPGGNPLDELLHILPGRHYGFPFRHPKYLPDVVDEPSVVGFGPQHQSTCGFRFNEPAPGRGVFGPGFWEGDALVTGFSRGKLWRVPLVKTGYGYVGKPILIASFDSLPTDVALSPKGDLIVAAHSGLPDWGAGPKADGHLFKLSLTDPHAPQPVLAWAEGPLEVRVAFDRPVNAARLGPSTILAGEFVREGDRYEVIRPGYKVVQEQLASPRHELKVANSRILDDERTLQLAVSPHPWQATYALALTQVAATLGSTVRAPVDMAYTLHGAEVDWTATNSNSPEWQGWLPHLDTAVTRALCGPSATHHRLFQQWTKKGTLRLRTKLVLPGREATVRVLSAQPVRAHGEQELKLGASAGPGTHISTFKLMGGSPRWIELALETGGGGDPRLELTYHTDLDPYERSLPLESLLLPWAPSAQPGKRESRGTNEFVLTGDARLGREVFFSAQAQCATCHSFRGDGGKVGPDLTPSLERDPAAVLRDIVQPNAAINPDFVSVNVELKDGDILSGIVQAQDETQVTLVDLLGKHGVVPRHNIARFQAGSLSLMPEGFSELGEAALQDLLAFLCGKDAR